MTLKVVVRVDPGRLHLVFFGGGLSRLFTNQKTTECTPQVGPRVVPKNCPLVINFSFLRISHRTWGTTKKLCSTTASIMSKFDNMWPCLICMTERDALSLYRPQSFTFLYLHIIRCEAEPLVWLWSSWHAVDFKHLYPKNQFAHLQTLASTASSRRTRSISKADAFIPVLEVFSGRFSFASCDLLATRSTVAFHSNNLWFLLDFIVCLWKTGNAWNVVNKTKACMLTHVSLPCGLPYWELWRLADDFNWTTPHLSIV